MLINLFVQGKGLQYLQSIYGLTTAQIEYMKKHLYTHVEADAMMTDKSADEYIQIYCYWESEKRKEIIRRDLTKVYPAHWEVDVDSMDTFLKEAHIKLDYDDLSYLRFRCIHVSPSIDGGESIRKHGLLKLTELLEMDTPLSSFLADYGIVVKPSEKWYSINGNKYSVMETDLAIKLYDTNAEIEALIAGEMKTLKEYSCVEYNPEFLRELSPLCGIDLQTEWAKRRNALLYVSFDASFDECANIADMYSMRGPDNYERIQTYLNKQYEYGTEPIGIWRNYWLIYECIKNSCPGRLIERSPMALRADVRLDSKRINVQIVDN